MVRVWLKDEFDELRGYREEADLLKELESDAIDRRTYVERSHIPEVYEHFHMRQPLRYTRMAEGLLPALADAIADELTADGHDMSEYRARRERHMARRVAREEAAV